MPNVRKAGKKFVGAWIPDALYLQLKRVAAKQKRPVSEVMDELLTTYAANHPPDALHDAAPSSAIRPETKAKVLSTLKTYGSLRRAK